MLAPGEAGVQPEISATVGAAPAATASSEMRPREPLIIEAFYFLRG